MEGHCDLQCHQPTQLGHAAPSGGSALREPTHARHSTRPTHARNFMGRLPSLLFSNAALPGQCHGLVGLPSVALRAVVPPCWADLGLTTAGRRAGADLSASAGTAGPLETVTDAGSPAAATSFLPPW